MRLVLACVAVCATAGAARATPAIAVDPTPPPAPVAVEPADEDRRIVFEATGTMLIATLGGYSATGWGPQLVIGRRTGELTLLAYAGLLETQAVEMYYGPEHHGQTLRVGAGARFSFLTVSPDRNLELDLGFEVDAERQMVRWAEGGAIDRTAILGGLILNMAMGDRKRARRAVHYGLRMGGAEGPGSAGGIDFVALFEIGMHWSG